MPSGIQFPKIIRRETMDMLHTFMVSLLDDTSPYTAEYSAERSLRSAIFDKTWAFLVSRTASWQSRPHRTNRFWHLRLSLSWHFRYHPEGRKIEENVRFKIASLTGEQVCKVKIPTSLELVKYRCILRKQRGVFKIICERMMPSQLDNRKCLNFLSFGAVYLGHFGVNWWRQQISNGTQIFSGTSSSKRAIGNAWSIRGTQSLNHRIDVYTSKSTLLLPISCPRQMLSKHQNLRKIEFHSPQLPAMAAGMADHKHKPRGTTGVKVACVPKPSLVSWLLQSPDLRSGKKK